MSKPSQERFDALLALVRAGNEDAVGDLWREFAYDARPHLSLSETETQNHQE